MQELVAVACLVQDYRPESSLYLEALSGVALPSFVLSLPPQGWDIEEHREAARRWLKDALALLAEENVEVRLHSVI